MSSFSRSFLSIELLRSNAYEEDAPYLIRKSTLSRAVPDIVIMYLVGVGDRHTEFKIIHT